MNRPPGQGFPYDQDHPKPPEYRIPVAPRGRILCGYPVLPAAHPHGPILCSNTAPCPIHRNQRVDLERDAEEAQLNQAAAIEAEQHKAAADLAPIPRYDPASPLDLHEQLHPVDEAPWSVRARLAKALGRRALATRLADALPPLLGAELADRLDTIVTQALTEQQAQITQQLSDEYHTARARLEADAAQKLRELHDERYRSPSRLD